MEIITKTLKIKTTNKNITYYKQFYKNINSGDEIEIKVEELPPTSKLKIDVICTNCDSKQNISYFSYLRNIKNYGYYSCKKCSTEKSKKTLQKNYGVDRPLQLEKFLNKMIETNLKRHGVKYVTQLESVKEKSKETCNKNYGTNSYTQSDEYKEFMKKYWKNHDYTEQNKKTIETCMKRYNVEFVTQLEETKSKERKTKKDKYGDENYNNRAKYIQTNLDLHGVENPMQVKEIREKQSNSIFKNHGVHYAAQSEEFFDKMMKSGLKIQKYKDTTLYYQGSYEKDFLDKYYDKLTIERGPSIIYDIDKIYYSDFYIKELNLIIEIKSTYWYNKHKDMVLEKENACKINNYNYMMILNKNYTEFENIYKK